MGIALAGCAGIPSLEPMVNEEDQGFAIERDEGNESIPQATPEEGGIPYSSTPLMITRMPPLPPMAGNRGPCPERSSTSEEECPIEEFVQWTIEDLARRLDVSKESIEVTSIEEVTWPDAGLGLHKKGEMYAQVVVPGYRILLTHQGITYEYRASGKIVKYAGPLNDG